MLYTADYESPLGRLLIAVNESRALVRLDFIDPERSEQWRLKVGKTQPSTGHCAEVADQLREYFAGERKAFTLTLAAQGTPFQKQVWELLVTIPYGKTTSYGDLARRIGTINASRAVGLANGANPISIIVPCHRVIGSNGALTGYGGGLDRKRALLALEGVTVGAAQAQLF